MSISRIPASLAALLVIFALAAHAEAQREIHHIPPWVDPDGNNPDLVHPFIDPLAFDPDWNFFAPADVDEFGGGPDARIGWFATYDRMHLWVSRPESQIGFNPTGTALLQLPDSTGGDYASGNRFDFGYETEEDHGWHMSIWDLGGPHYNNVVVMERIDVFEPDDEINNDPTTTQDLRSGGGGGGGGGGQQQQNQMRNGVPARDANDPITGARDYRVTNSINDLGGITNVELNKTFRWKPLAYGSVIQPFFGFRYMKVDDLFRRDTYNRFDEDGNVLGTGIPPVNVPPMLGPITNFEIEEYTVLKSQIQNTMVGGQVGVRWYKRKSRWLLSSEARLFAFQNFQELTTQFDLERTYYDGVSVDADIESVIYDQSRSSGHSTEFVFGGEVRAEAAFELTRDVSLRFGMNFIEMARGIGRGGSLGAGDGDQDLTLIGITGGFTVNR